jgi:RED-like protein C-terminal region
VLKIWYCTSLQEKGSQSRSNFATEEEWQAHKGKQETLPKVRCVSFGGKQMCIHK